MEIEIDRLAKMALYRLSEFRKLGMARLDSVEVCNKFLRLRIFMRPGQCAIATDEELKHLLPYPMEFSEMLPEAIEENDRYW